MAVKAHIHAVTRTGAAVLGAASVLATSATGCGGSGGTGGGGQSAADFIGKVTTQFSRGQSGRLWDTLHPADQAIVNRARYMACQSNSGFDLKKVKVIETYADTVDIVGRSTPSTAISVRVTADDGVTNATMHAVKVNGAWRWILPPADVAAYKQGKCPPS